MSWPAFPLPAGTWTITSPWRPPNRPDHRGIDLGAMWGTVLTAVADATVHQVGYEEGGAGFYVNLSLVGSGDLVKYFHMAERSPLEVGSRITAGTAVGRVGNTGASSGAHLHFEQWRSGADIDPWPDLQAAGDGEDDLDMTADELRQIVREEVERQLAPRGGAPVRDIIEDTYNVSRTVDGRTHAQLVPNGDDPSVRSLVERIANATGA